MFIINRRGLRQNPIRDPLYSVPHEKQEALKARGLEILCSTFVRFRAAVSDTEPLIRAQNVRAPEAPKTQRAPYLLIEDYALYHGRLLEIPLSCKVDSPTKPCWAL